MLFWLWLPRKLRPELQKIFWDYGDPLQSPHMEGPFEGTQEYAVDLRSLPGKRTYFGRKRMHFGGRRMCFGGAGGWGVTER